MRSGIAHATALAAIWICHPAIAQDADTGVRQDGVEDIIVTAQRRAERLQDVPVTVTALTSAALQTSGVLNTQGLQLATPGLVTHQISNAFLPFIRGVGSNQSGPGNESSVAVYLDGVYQGVKSGNVIELANIERIEVLKGPQGTLFGRNATGGAINIVTKSPSADPVIDLQAGYGRFDERRLQAYAAGGITDTLSASLSFTGRWKDGYIRDIVRHRDQNPSRAIIAMGKLQWEPTDAFTATLSASYAEISDPTPNSFHVAPGTVSTAESLGVPVTKDAGKAALSRARSYNETKRATLDLSYDLGGLAVKSITGYVDNFYSSYIDLDGSSANLLGQPAAGPSEMFSQELQLQSTGNGPFTWITGLYYMTFDDGFGKMPNDNTTAVGLPTPFRPSDLLMPGASATGVTGYVRTVSKSAFAQGTYEILPSTRLTLGARYSIDRKEVRADRHVYSAVPGNGSSGVPVGDGVLGNDGLVFAVSPLASMDLRKTWKKPTWRIALDHKFSADVMAYASYSRGFKAGSYTVGNVNPAQQPVNPETLDAYEVGLKTELFDRKLRLNIAAFYYDYRDIHVALVTSGGISSVQNAAAARLYGLDVDFTAAPTRNLTLRGGLNLLDSKYKDYDTAQLLLPRVAGENCTAVPTAIGMDRARQIAGGTPTGGNCVYSLNASGQNVVIAPKLTANFGGEYMVPVGERSHLTLAASIYYNDGYDVAPGGFFTHVGSFEELTASLTWHGDDDRYFVRLWGENLTGNVHPLNILPLGQVFMEVSSPPARYGITLGLKFGAR